MINLYPLDSICFLLDFVNEKEWSKQRFRDLQIQYRLTSTMYGEEHGYEETAYLRKFDCKRFFVCEKTNPIYLDFLDAFSPNPCLIEQKTLTEEDFFGTLIELQASWRAFLAMTSKKGHNFEFLNLISQEVKWQLVGGSFSFSPQIGVFYFHATTFEDFLEFHYLHAASQLGEHFKRLRFCNNAKCEEMFVYNRPKQKYCKEACRHEHNNKKKIESGYLAEHQAKGRIEKPLVYQR